MQKILKRVFMIIIAIIAVIAVGIGCFLLFINVKYKHVDKDIRLMGWVYDTFSTYETADELKQFSLNQPKAELAEDEDLDIEEIVIQSSAGNDLSLIVYRSKNVKPDATALSLKARDTGDIAIAFQMPISPMINNRMDTESMKGNTEFLWDEAKSKAGWELYLGDLYGTDDVPTYAAVMRETDFSNLPPTYSYVGTLDPFYDDTINYITAIKEAGGTAEYDVYERAYHGFDIVPSAAITKRANAKLLEEYQYAVEHYYAEQQK